MSTLGRRLASASLVSCFFTAAAFTYPAHSLVTSIYRMGALSFFGGVAVGFIVSYAYVEWRMTRTP